MKLHVSLMILVITFLMGQNVYAGSIVVSSGGHFESSCEYPEGGILSSGEFSIPVGKPLGFGLPSPTKGEPEIIKIFPALNISVIGNLYIDETVLQLASRYAKRIRFSAGESIKIYAPDDLQSELPDAFEGVVIRQAAEADIFEKKDVLFYGAFPYSDISFKATGNIVVADFSACYSVPTPASASLIILGFLLLTGVRIRFLKPRNDF